MWGGISNTLPEFLVLLVAMSIPALVMACSWRQAQSRQQRRRLAIAFLAGVSIAGPIALAVLPNRGLLQEALDPWMLVGLRAIVLAALPEETLKLLALLVLVSWQPTFFHAGTRLSTGAILGLGFAAVESLLHTLHDARLSIVLARAMTAVPCHVFLGAIMGSYVGAYHQASRAKIATRSLLIIKAWGIPVLLHSFYNLPLLSGRLTLATDPLGVGAISLTMLTLLLLAAWTRYLFVGVKPAP